MRSRPSSGQGLAALANWVSNYTVGRRATRAGAAALTTSLRGGLMVYALARMRFHGKNMIFTLYLSTIMVPAQIDLIPVFWLGAVFPLFGGNNIFFGGVAAVSAQRFWYYGAVGGIAGRLVRADRPFAGRPAIGSACAGVRQARGVPAPVRTAADRRLLQGTTPPSARRPLGATRWRWIAPGCWNLCLYHDYDQRRWHDGGDCRP